MLTSNKFDYLNRIISMNINRHIPCIYMQKTISVKKRKNWKFQNGIQWNLYEKGIKKKLYSREFNAANRSHRLRMKIINDIPIEIHVMDERKSKPQLCINADMGFLWINNTDWKCVKSKHRATIVGGMGYSQARR